MATKKECMPFKNVQNLFAESNDHYSNLNLNQNHHSSNVLSVDSKSVLSNANKKYQNYGFENDANLPSLKSLNSWSKSNQHLSSKFLHIDCGSEVEEKFKNAKSSNLNKSTLSLHITAYENLSEASNEFSSENEEEEGMKNERAGSNKKWEIMKQFSADSQSKTENLFEFPRQQESKKIRTLDVAQFKASQKLFNPNTMHQSVPTINAAQFYRPLQGHRSSLKPLLNLGFKLAGVGIMMQRNFSLNPAIKAFTSKRQFSLTPVSLLNAHEYDLTDPEVQKLYKLYRPERITPHKRGIEMLKTPSLNKGMAFSLFERHYFGIHGLLPPAFMTADQQAYRIMTKLRQQPDDLARYIQLDGLQDRNEKLFYKVLCENIKELMPIVYTPTVGQACQHFGFIYRNPKGVYVTINDNSISKIYQILCNWPSDDVRAIVVTDGERILGLGDLGAYGIGIPVGKLALYSALAGIQPKWCLPVLLDVGTDNPKLLNDPFYIGLRRKRVRGEEYDRLLDNFMHACTKRFGHDTLIQFEDFGNKNAYRLLDRFQESYCMFNDDIQGTASVVVAGLLACARVTGKPLSKKRFVFLGAGGAATGVAEMCVRQMQSEGLSFEQACDRIYLMDIDGLITKNRLRNLDRRHFPFAKDMADTKDLLSLVKEVKPEALIGASTVKGAFTHDIIKLMAEINPRPIIFALSNPTSKAECTAEDAYKLTNGNVLFASGSPFPNVEVNGKLFKPGQGNNAYIFPGVALAVILFKVRYIDNKLFLMAARRVANSVTQKSFNVGRIYPRIDEIRELSIQIAIELANTCYADGTAKLYPEPKDKEMFIRSQIYNPEYDELINHTWEWPEQDMKAGFPVPVVRRTSTDD